MSAASYSVPILYIMGSKSLDSYNSLSTHQSFIIGQQGFRPIDSNGQVSYFYFLSLCSHIYGLFVSFTPNV